jgi:hypothetical protein
VSDIEFLVIEVDCRDDTMFIAADIKNVEEPCFINSGKCGF